MAAAQTIARDSMSPFVCVMGSCDRLFQSKPFFFWKKRFYSQEIIYYEEAHICWEAYSILMKLLDTALQ